MITCRKKDSNEITGHDKIINSWFGEADISTMREKEGENLRNRGLE